MVKALNNNVTKNLQRTGIRRFNELVAKVPGAIKLTVGEIDLPTPANTKLRGINAITENVTKYTPNAGDLELRTTISEYLAAHYHLNYSAKDEIIVTVGGSEAIDTSFRTILEPEDEIIIPAPCFPGYLGSGILSQSKIILVDTSSSDFKLTPEQLENSITDATKLVVLNYPNNPTGSILTTEELEALAKIIIKHDLYVLTDEMYATLVYDGIDIAPSIAAIDGMKERTIIVNGVSKSSSMTGWRVGYIATSAAIVEQALKVHQYAVASPASMAQKAAITALTTDFPETQKMAALFEHRRDVLVSYLSKLDLKFNRPVGAFYCFLDISEFGMDSWSFAEKMLYDYKLAVVPGNSFSEYGDNYVRLSFAVDEKIIVEAMKRLTAGVTELRKRNV
ncbi:pyridoxal phosphate-dependent aminotransferase [Liquorilactobacillus mali]|uniref:Aminotransferase n=1 Tax=Liquorilactobacillus mali KCTC 3596 = DSM 20444 TaxID=1046596 RepID=J0KW36_9LACO|nr:aminotransferase class I/II-fold pyridoxal phosphate-dependent enzyme [Liquorilactobacillus mali]EJE97300.1 aminotransferase [Liquorilactobacillus mali KCTC 3596 = DSM 20444]KRN11372.1 aminotransferase [Liquorilactobacillus mali KCTC 3596 = DSM 20444]MDC7953123.1 aminotransferase class I/II-fold pyridoxal phosphate-dependent enzyme [Liquorilactobacillus mali]MDV7757284.1 aminotransferase class I/II-fold pyridoxal phosphate-dependent enzyme [Liquorilactobacillus mali]QFQ75294.1 aminotransfer